VRLPGVIIISPLQGIKTPCKGEIIITPGNLALGETG